MYKRILFNYLMGISGLARRVQHLSAVANLVSWRRKLYYTSAVADYLMVSEGIRPLKAGLLAANHPPVAD